MLPVRTISRLMRTFSLSTPSVATTTAFSSTATAPSSSSPPAKHRVPQKRASKLLNTLRAEECAKLRKPNVDYSKVRSGDSVLIERLPYMSSNEPDKIKGVVIAKTNRAMDSSLVLLNMEHGTAVRRRMLMYSPLVQNITVLQKAFIHKGMKRVRRSKLYYLEDRNFEGFTVN